jgi:hypothetical protein
MGLSGSVGSPFHPLTIFNKALPQTELDYWAL